MSDAALEASGLYILTARNSQGEEKYPVILTVLPNIDLTHVINNDGNFFTFTIVEYMAKYSGFTGAEKARKHGYREFFSG